MARLIWAHSRIDAQIGDLRAGRESQGGCYLERERVVYMRELSFVGNYCNELTKHLNFPANVCVARAALALEAVVRRTEAALAMGNRISSAVSVKRRDNGSVIDKLTEAQLDEFREAFNSFDKVCAGCGLLVVDVALGREDPLPARTRRNAACV